MRTYQLEREQFVPRPIDQVFAFFTDVRNLEAITPPWLKFRIVSPTPIDMKAGTEIEYELAWRLVPIRWKTVIRKWQPPRYFVDGQVRGPYKLWEHTHSFEGVNGGTQMKDSVRYALPLGPLGRLAHALRVRRDLNRIFDFRAETIARLLG